MDDTDRAAAEARLAGQPGLPAEVADAVRRLADESGADQTAVLLAAQLEVAAVVAGAADLLPGEDTWLELIGRMAAEEWREAAKVCLG